TSCDEHVTASTYAFLDGVEDDCEQCKDDSPTKNSGDLGAAGGDPSGTGPGSGSTAMNVDASPCGAGLPPCTDGTPRMRVGERLECGSGQRKSQHQVSRRRASGTGAAQPP
ncbi:MAG: hypothetical protein HYZ53_24305, partial [Planctomycetes bacterium]|nr:hypothetical protein [Planctomycetota bacterium]